MDDEKSKDQQRQRYLKSLRHMVGHEEEKRRKAAASRRRAGRPDAGSGRRRFDPEDEDYEVFEKIQRSKRAPAPAASRDLTELPRATVTGVHHGRVDLDDGETARIAGHLLVDPTFRLVVGDEVAVKTENDQARIEGRFEPRSSLSRPDPGNPHKALVLAANVDIAVITVAAKEPELRPGLIDRLLLAVAYGGVGAGLCVNKIDLLDAAERVDLEATLAAYAGLGCPVFYCSAAAGEGIAALRAHLEGQTCVFVGHSGVGKSSILNALDPAGERPTGATRDHDGKGRHTTTWSTLWELEGGTRVIDTPGVRSFGLDQLTPEQVRDGFAEFGPFAGGCSYNDCTHVHEPDCAVRAAAAAGDLAAERYASYRRILADL